MRSSFDLQGISDTSGSKDPDAEFDRLDLAAQWYAEQRSESFTKEQEHQLHQWLLADPENQKAWQKILNVEQRFQFFNNENRPQLGEVLERSYAIENTQRRSVMKGLVLFASGIGLAGFTLKAQWPSALLADIHNASARVENIQLTPNIHLSVGSHAAINTKENRYGPQLELIKGQVLIRQTDTKTFFSAGNLFIEIFDNSEFTAEYAMSEQNPNLKVTLINGHAKVIGNERLTLTPNETIELGPTGNALSRMAQPQALAWLENRLDVSRLPLSQWVDRIGFYRHGYLHCHPSVNAMLVSGRFPTDDTDLALTMLERSLPIKIRYYTPWWVSIQPA